MKKKFILPRRLFAFALAFALTFTSFSPLSVYADGDEEQVQQTATEEEHCDDCCECHEGENSANLGEINPPAVENPTPTEVPVVITEIPQNPEPVVDGLPTLQDDAIQTLDTDSFALFAMPLTSTNSNGGKNPESCNHPQGRTMTTTIEPDCITAGYVEVYCYKCNSVVSHDVLPATGKHSYDNGVITTDPTCTKKGVKTFTCTVCKTTRTEDVELLDHVSVEVPAKANSCTEDGMTAGHKCSVCGTILDGCQTIPMSDHNYEEVGKVEPTCTTAGHTAGTKCSVCGKVLSGCEVLEKTKHDFEVIEKSDPICGQEDGHISYQCTKCEYNYAELIEAKLEHDYEDIPEKKATCTEGGHSAYQKCKNCGYIPVEPTNTPPFGGDHMYSFNRTIKEATCSEDGINEYKCARCGDLTTRTTIKTAHKFGPSYDVVITEPTCTSSGLKQVYHDCTICHEKVLVQDNVVMGYSEHEYGEYEFVPGSNCQERNKMVRTCKKCSHEDAKYVDEFGYSLGYGEHDFEGNYVPDGNATCQSVGTQTAHCKNSGCSATDTKPGDTLGDHVWSTNSTVDKEPTCKNLGSKRRDCIHEGCNSFQTQAIPVVNHSFTEVKEVVEPACLEKGYTVYKCKWCEETEIRDYVDALDHDFEEEWQVETPATCTENGTQIKRCRRPGCKWVQREVIFKTGHTYEEEWKVIKEPTCQELGVKAKYCKNEGCHNYLSSAINKVGHSFTEVKEVVEPTCLEKGYTVYKCKWCEETEIRDYVDALDHDFEDEWQVETPATCTENGTQIKHCRRPGCKWVQRDVIFKTGHNYEEEWKVIKEPTCQELGVKAKYCKNKGCHNYLSSAINKVGHSFTEVKEVVKPTCTEKGYTVYKCKWCEETEIRDYVDPHEHDYGEWFTVTDPTCQADGEKRHNCKDCEAYETRPIAKLDHHVFSEFVKKVEPTCIDDGYTTYKCTWCEETENRDIVKAEGHKYGEWYTVTDPTCQAEGEARRDCKNCEHFETKPIEKVDHAYNKFVKAVAPTCESRGYSVYKCQWCEKTETRDYVDALGHKHVTDPGKSATCTSDGYTEKEYCSRCGKVFRERETTKATGHNWGPEQFENIVFPTTISVGGYDSVRYCWNCGCKHSVHVTLPMITLKPVAPIKPLPSVPTLPIPSKPPVKPAQPDDPMDIIDRSEEQKADDIAESPEDVKDKEIADSSKSEEVVDDKSNETSEQIVTDNGKDDQKKSEITSQDPKDNETGEDVDTDYSTYFIIAFGILLLIILITLFIILMSKRKNDEEDGELK